MVDKKQNELASDDDFTEALRRVITDAIRMSGMKDPKVAEKCGVTKQSVGKWKLKGQLEINNLRRLEHCLGLEVGEILKLAEADAANNDPVLRELSIKNAKKRPPRPTPRKTRKGKAHRRQAA